MKVIDELKRSKKVIEEISYNSFEKLWKQLNGENSVLINPRVERIQMMAKLQYLITEIECGVIKIPKEYNEANWENLYRLILMSTEEDVQNVYEKKD